METCIAICMGKDCRRRRAAEVEERVQRALRDVGLGARTRRAGCMGACGGGASVRIEPAGVVVGRVKPKRATDLVAWLVRERGPRKGWRLRIGKKKSARKARRAIEAA